MAGRFAIGERATIETAGHFPILMVRAKAQTLARPMAGYVARTVAAD